MSRLAAYVGPQITLAQFLLRPPQGLAAPDREAAAADEPGAGAGGYGFGWFGPDDGPLTYTCSLPLWCDHNLPALGEGLASSQWLAYAGDALFGTPPHPADLQPYADAELLFVHTGMIEDFAATLRPRLRAALEPEFEAQVRGTTAAEYLFALLRQILAQDEDMPVDEGLGALVEFLAGNVDDIALPLNIVLGDGSRLYALRHALNAECAGLYYSADDEDFPDGMLVASQPLTERAWQAVPAHHLLVLDPQAPAQLFAL